MAQDQRLGDRIAILADADLQGAAIGYEARGMQANGIFGEADGFVRRREQRKLRRRTIEQVIEIFACEIALARHKGQFRVHLPRHQKVRAALGAGAEQIERDIGVARKAVAAILLGYELRDDIDPAIDEITRRVGIIRGYITLLRLPHPEPLPREKEEFVDLDIRRKRARAQRLGIGQFRPATEQPFDHRFEKTPFKHVLVTRLFQRERGEDGEIDRRICRGARIERVCDMRRLTKPQRKAEHNRLADLGDDRVGDFAGIRRDMRFTAHADQVAPSFASTVPSKPLPGT